MKFSQKENLENIVQCPFKESVCSVLINDNQALLNIYFHHNSFRNKVMEQTRKITTMFQNLQKLVRSRGRGVWARPDDQLVMLFFYLALY